MNRRDIKIIRRLGAPSLFVLSLVFQFFTISQSSETLVIEGWDDSLIQESSNQENISRTVRALRPDGPPTSGAGSIARPCGVDLEQLRQLICQIRSIIIIITETTLLTIESKVCDIDSKIGDLDGLATSTSVLVTPEDINMDELTVIEWLKSIYLLLRGW